MCIDREKPGGTRVPVVALMGVSITSGNRGVMALGTSLIELCLRAVPEAEVVLLASHNRHEEVSFPTGNAPLKAVVVPARLSPRSHLRDHMAMIVLASLAWRALPSLKWRRFIARRFPWIRVAKDALLVGDIRGGDSFSDIYGMGRFLTGFFMAWSIILIRGSVVQFPQTYGPYHSNLSRILAKFIFRRSNAILARDRISQMVAENFVGPNSKLALCPDVAFALDAGRPQKAIVNPPLEGDRLPQKVIGLNVNGLMYNGGYTRKNMFGLKLDYRGMLPGLISCLLQEHDGELWLVPHAYAKEGDVESDPAACRQVKQMLPEQLKERVRIVTGEYDCHELKWIIGQCDFFIGSRMHSCIAALSQGIPCVGIAYSRKFQGVFETVGMGEWVVDGRETTGEQAIGRVLELYCKRDEVREELKKNAENARKRLFEVFDRLFHETLGA